MSDGKCGLNVRQTRTFLDFVAIVVEANCHDESHLTHSMDKDTDRISMQMQNLQIVLASWHCKSEFAVSLLLYPHERPHPNYVQRKTSFAGFSLCLR